jgi:hypothetical protein
MSSRDSGQGRMSNKRGKRKHLPASKPSEAPSTLPAPERVIAAGPKCQHEASDTRSAVDDLASANLRLTRWMVRWTAGLAIVGIVTAGVGFVQWKALLRTDGTTREAFTAVQRPFIIATDLEVIQDFPLYWRFRTILENTGSTPTKNMTVTSSVSFSIPIVPDSPTDTMELNKRPNEAYPTVTDHFVGPHGKVGIDAISLVAKTLEEMAEQRADFYVFGIVRYNDQYRRY